MRTADDVAETIRRVRSAGAELAVRDGGIVLDLSGMKAIDIDVDNRTACYVNFVAGGDAQQVRDDYPGTTWERLRAVKRRYDPSNFFHGNQNIPPAEDD